MKLAVTLTMSWPLPCRVSLPLRLALCHPRVSAGLLWRQAPLIVSRRNVPNVFAHTSKFTDFV